MQKLICLIKVVEYLLFFPGWPEQIWSPTDKQSITLIPAYIPTLLNVEADYLSQGQLLLGWHLSPQDGCSGIFTLWGLPEVDLVASSHTTQCQHYYTL